MKYSGYRNGAKNPFEPAARRVDLGGFIYRPHQNKERAYVDALRAVGYRPMDINHFRFGIKFGMFDLDCGANGVGYNLILGRLHQRGMPVFMYPHAARPMVVYDGLLTPWPHAKCAFVIAPGHVDLMTRIGYPIPMEITGWTFCEQLPFQPVEQADKILFGPIHANGNGWLSPVDKDLNRRTHERLVEYCRESGAKLTVRHVHALELSGLQAAPGVTYLRARPDGTHAEIDAADLVVGHQTFAYIAVARGKPVLMMGENVPPRIGNNDTNFQYVKSWEKYADDLMFPLDILSDKPAAALVAAACKRNARVTAWRKHFIGEPFDAPAFVRALEAYL